MFTSREAAQRQADAALADRRWTAFGLKPDERAGLYRARIDWLRRALALVEAAHAAPRLAYAEPTDAGLAALARRLRQVLEAAEPVEAVEAAAARALEARPEPAPRVIGPRRTWMQ